MKFSEYRQYDATGLADLVRKGETCAQELLDVAITAADQFQESLNAIVVRCDEQARQQALSPVPGPFSGVPFLAKDLFQEMAGQPANSGCRALHRAGFRAKEDAEIVRRWRASGVIIFGRTNTPEFGIKAVTEPELFGPARNPWNVRHTPGGSSGGSAAAVAAGIVPMAGANDGGGSIRIPAAHCGLFGLKPTRGRTPWGPTVTEQLQGCAMNHVVSRSVRDSAAMLDATHGPETGSLTRLAPPAHSFLQSCERDPSPLRIAFCTDSPLGTRVHEDARKAVMQTVALLESLGHHVEEAAPELDGVLSAQYFLTQWFCNVAQTVDDVTRQTGCAADEFELDTRALHAFGSAIKGPALIDAQIGSVKQAVLLARFHQQYDLWLTPTLGMPPAQIGEVATPWLERQAMKALIKTPIMAWVQHSGIAQKVARENLKWVPFTQLANITGVPAMSVPLYQTAKGLPLGVQFVAGTGREDLLFQLAAQLERAAPWSGLAPM